MKVKQGFELRDICGEKVILATGIENVDFNQMISLNETAAYLWQAVGQDEFDAQRLADLLCEAYEVNPDTALADAENVIQQWTECGIVE